jgi:hypothetical protein
MAWSTDLVIGGRVIPLAASRGITQTYRQIRAGQLRRTVNGTLINTTRTTHKKYRTRIDCEDLDTPAIADLYKGDTVTVECVAPWRVPGGSTTVTLPRDPVSGSIVGYKTGHQKVTVSSVSGRDVTFDEAPDWVEFRPILTIMIDDVDWDQNEATAKESWSISGEEV